MYPEKDFSMLVESTLCDLSVNLQLLLKIHKLMRIPFNNIGEERLTSFYNYAFGTDEQTDKWA